MSQAVSPFGGQPVFPMATAPRNGLTIFVGDADCGEFLMHWEPTATNGLFPGRMGFWVALDGSMTWSEHDDAGPSYWRPMAEETPTPAVPDTQAGLATQAVSGPNDRTRDSLIPCSSKALPEAGVE